MLLEALPEVPLKVQKVKLDGCLRLRNSRSNKAMQSEKIRVQMS
jgi:hypothetical protein